MSKKINKLSNITAADVDALQKALSVGYNPIDPISQALLDTLHRLGLSKKILMGGYGGVLQVEDIMLPTFDMKDLKLWPNIGSKKK